VSKWYSVHDEITGLLHSIGTVVGEHLPSNLIVREHDEEPNAAEWDPNKRDFVKPAPAPTPAEAPAEASPADVQPAESTPEPAATDTQASDPLQDTGATTPAESELAPTVETETQA
jgi:hypothetical protein